MLSYPTDRRHLLLVRTFVDQLIDVVAADHPAFHSASHPDVDPHLEAFLRWLASRVREDQRTLRKIEFGEGTEADATESLHDALLALMRVAAPVSERASLN